MNLLLFAALLLAADAKEPPKPASAETAMQGKWVAVSELSGGKLREYKDRATELKIAKEGVKWIIPGQDVKWEIDFDFSKDPVDVMIGVEGEKERLFGICKLDGELLLLCYRYDGLRPSKFESLPRSGDRLVTFRRVKSEKK